MIVKLQDLSKSINHIQFVVVLARYGGKWIFVRHRERSSWEMTGGHVEPGESLDAAAGRELWEECGALEFELTPLCDYSVNKEGVATFGRFYLAEVSSLGDLPDFEIGEIALRDEPPEELTYPQILPLLFERALLSGTGQPSM